jgi:hypothetical protein
VGTDIDLEDFAGPQVGDEQQPPVGIQAGVVKSRIVPGNASSPLIRNGSAEGAG